MTNSKLMVMFGAAGVVAVVGAVAVGLVIARVVRGPDDADFCNVALVPELAEEIGVDLPTRLQLAAKGRSLLRSLSGYRGLKRGDPMGEERGRELIAEAGHEVKELLSEESRRAFAKQFRGREIVPVRYRADETKGFGPDNPFLSFGWTELGEDALKRSLAERQRQLAEVFEAIPSEGQALELLEHSDDAVNSAAARWLNGNSSAHAEVTSRSEQRLEKIQDRLRREMRAESEERRREMAARSEERGKEMKREHEETVRELLAKQKREYPSTRSRGEQAKRKRERDEEYQARVREMKKRHEERVRRMREERGR